MFVQLARSPFAANHNLIEVVAVEAERFQKDNTFYLGASKVEVFFIKKDGGVLWSATLDAAGIQSELQEGWRLAMTMGEANQWLSLQEERDAEEQDLLEVAHFRGQLEKVRISEAEKPVYQKWIEKQAQEAGVSPTTWWFETMLGSKGQAGELESMARDWAEEDAQAESRADDLAMGQSVQATNLLDMFRQWRG